MDFHGPNTAPGASFLLGLRMHLLLAEMDRVNLILATVPKQNPVASDALIFRLIGTPCAAKKQNRTADLRSASYVARPSRDHIATDTVRVKLSSLSTPVSPDARLA